MTSQITLYNNCKIVPDKNFKVDDIEVYLSSFDPSEIYSGIAQYFKHALEVKYKFNFTQGALEMQSVLNLNYARIKDPTHPSPILDRGKIVYYFITDKKWISETCIELTLKMDVVNTLLTEYIAGNIPEQLIISPKTTILRQHKNRWKQGTSPELFLPVIDLYSEGINPVLFKTKEKTLYEIVDYTDFVLGSFYLIYRSDTIESEENPNPAVNIYLCADGEMDIDVKYASGYSGNITWRDLDSNYAGDTIIIYGGDLTSNVGASVHFKRWVSRNETTNVDWEITSSSQAILLGRKTCAFGEITPRGFIASITYKITGISAKEFDNFYFQNVRVARQFGGLTPYADLTPENVITYHPMSKMNANNILGKIGAITDIDRTDPRLLKIVKLPYRPVAFDFDSEGVLVSLPTGWVYETNIENFPNMLRYLGIDVNALRNSMFLESEDFEDGNPYDILVGDTLSNLSVRVPRDDQFETKLLHSDYFVQKFVYDSFTFDFKAELMESDGGAQAFAMDFAVTLTMSSKFMFIFPFTQFPTGLKLDNQDYSGFVYVARNNEVPIFNSAYMNYIRTGYNFDIKTRNRQLASNIIGGSLSLVGAVASAVSSVATGGFGVAGAIGLGISAVTQFTRTAINTAQADQNIAEKLRSAEMQGLSVAGADDVDLMTEYTNDNKAKLVKYEVSPKMKKALADIFYYCGYVAGFQGVPDYRSRQFFNFVQADVIFDKTPNTPKEIIEELRNKFKDGITFLHHYDCNTLEPPYHATGWDFEQIYENWENFDY
ncbi:MAG: hypothetical protein J6T10_20415 [Methanobrevibacter sp.]|nr:hypothetical protein [Methanobrevibacter sp.]